MIKPISFKVVLITLQCVLSIALSAQHASKPKRVIFLIGDGMGLSQISGAMSTYTGQNAFLRFPFIGLSKTSSAKQYITDSGAGATAFSIGKKTYNHAIGVDADTVPLPTLFELAKQRKLSTGVVVTSSIQHATPASFYAHVGNRRLYDSISTFLLNGNCDIAIGGGADFIFNRKDKRDLSAELKASGFLVINDTILKDIAATKYIYLLAKDGMPTMQKGRGDYLKRAAEQAVKNLSTNKNGFMLMIEGSQIDWGGHENNYKYMASELYDFNETINVVLDMAAKDKEMLVVVTADHETGGLALNEHDDPLRFSPIYTTKDHSGVMVPVFAYGAGAQEFAGMYENTEIFNKLVKLLNLK
ncbi:MAG: alkaline phosphatase [Bacteroidetes bacterium]|nr:MAG: alkaline phosphatase [Bacteroidota bacterium]